ncbi:MAG: hypothetical protein ACFE91_08585 [Promethearchaeota archaeon]
MLIEKFLGLIKFFKIARINLNNLFLQKLIWRLVRILNINSLKKIPYLSKKYEFLSVDQKIILDREEIRLIKKYIKPNDIMLEWGCGGSTLLFSKYVKKCYSIEHNYPWYFKIKHLVPKNVKLKFISPNSHEKSITQKEKYKDYINIINKMKVPFFNKIFIDGRARVLCAREVIKYLNHDSIVFIHDFYSRPQYHTIFELYKEIDGVKDLIALKKRD